MHDPLFTAAYTGVNAGMIIVTADDPGMHSSQNEQDNRYYGRSAKVPVLEPADSAEAKDFVKLAFEISEQFDTPVLYRLTTRIAHSQSLLELEERQTVEKKPYNKDPKKYVMMPGNAKPRHIVVEQRLQDLAGYSDRQPLLNRIEWGSDRKRGVIASGAVYQYVKEALPEVSVLKIGMSFPLPQQLIQEFAAGVEELYVVEELEPFIEDSVKAMGISVKGRELFSSCGEIFAETIREKLGDGQAAPAPETAGIPVRPPVLCPGCPHRGTFYMLHCLGLRVSGDIGCYTLGALPPLSAMDTTICMGASITALHGMEIAEGREIAEKSVAVLGDSTFLHSGITGLLNTVYNGGTTTTLILDNSITAMTGHQQNPATGKNAKGEPAPAVDLEALCRACGVNRVQVVDPFDLKQMRKVLKEELAAAEPSVIIVRRPCVLLDRSLIHPALQINYDKCKNCGSCMNIGCPAICKRKDSIMIDAAQCVGCGLCQELCAFGAIEKGGM